MIKRLIVFSWIPILFFSSCDNTQSVESPDISIDEKSLVYDENKAYEYIEKQVSMGPRNPGSKGHTECADYLYTSLKLLCDTAYIQEFDAITYDGKKHKGKNILGKINPSNPNRILLSAHWDTRPIADQDDKNQSQPILGANDAGSGVGVILGLMDAFKKNPTAIGIDIVFFDLEDYGQPENSGFLPMEESWCIGSQYYAKNYKEVLKPRWGILFDMVGGANATFLKEGVSMLYASNLVSRVWANADKLGFGKYFLNEEMGTITDDHVSLNTIAQIPSLDIIHYKTNNGGFADYWHTHNDNMSAVDKSTLKAIGKTIEYTIREEEKIGN